MIKEEIEHSCRDCGSKNIVKNGRNVCGNQQYKCKDCKSSKVLQPKKIYSEEKKEEILRAYHERSSLRGVQRIFGVSRPTLSRWIKKKVESMPNLHETLVELKPEDKIETDEMWSFIGNKDNQCWLWIAICRRTRQIISFVMGDRDNLNCLCLIVEQPLDSWKNKSYSDKLASYDLFPSHSKVNKQSGQTNHVENFNNIVRQRNARYVRKSLSFSKCKKWHEIATKFFILSYNLDIKNSYVST